MKKPNFFMLSISALRLNFIPLKGLKSSLKDVLINYFFIVCFTSFFCVMAFSKLSDGDFWLDVILYTVLFFSLYMLIGYTIFVIFFRLRNYSFWAGVNVSLTQVMGFSFLNSVIGSGFEFGFRTVILSILFLYFAFVQSTVFSVVTGLKREKAFLAYGSVLFFSITIIIVLRQYFILSLQ